MNSHKYVRMQIQKFRFLLPLLVLTLAVGAVSLSVKSYRETSKAPTVVNSEDGSVQEASDTAVNQEENKGGLLSFIFGNKSNEAPTTEGVAEPSRTPIDTKFEDTSVELPIDQEKVVAIQLASGSDRPTAYTFHLRFDPKQIQVESVEAGDIWTKTTVLKSEIDNTKGTINFSAGQSFYEKMTDGIILLNINLKAKAKATVESELTIENTSKFAYVGLDYAVPLKSQSISVKVTK